MNYVRFRAFRREPVPHKTSSVRARPAPSESLKDCEFG
jgi:hypothetical protein